MAKKEGLVAEEGVTVMGGVNFGSEPYLITLHQYCRISSNVIFVNHDGGTWAFRNTWSKYSEVIKYGKIEIGEYSFIGAGTIIMPNVHIGRNCVIGAGSVVTKDIPDESVAVGIPARVIKSTNDYAENCLTSMDVDFDVKEYKNNKKKYLLNHVK